MTAVIINFNRLRWPSAMADYLAECPGIRPLILDNASTYPPTLEWYRTCSHRVVRLCLNLGHRAPWLSGLAHTLGPRYIVTDPDLDLSCVPTDLLQVLSDELDANRHLRKVGLGLALHDLPDNEMTRQVREWELNMWRPRLATGTGFYESPIDTTFALYAGDREALDFCLARRSDHPYVARHLPWYQSPDDLTEEDRYYLAHTLSPTHWSSNLRSRLTGHRTVPDREDEGARGTR